MNEDRMCAAIVAHWDASAAGDLEDEHDIYAEDAICDYPQSGERIVGRLNLQALRGHHPGKPSVSGLSEFLEEAMSGSRNTLSPTKKSRHIQ